MAIDATVGGADANSYVTLAEMTAYAATQSWNATWTAYTQDKKEISLISATKWLDTLTYSYSRNETTQKLSWPRTGATFDGVTISNRHTCPDQDGTNGTVLAASARP